MWRMRCLPSIAILAVACGAAYAAAPFSVDSFDIDVGQDYVTDVAVYENGSRAIVMFNDGPIRLRIIDAEKRGVINTLEGDFDQHILATGGAVVGRQFFVSCYYGLVVIDLESKEITQIHMSKSPPSGYASSGVVVSSKADRIYSISASDLLAVDTETQEVVAQVPVAGAHQYGLAISRDDREIYVTDGNTGMLSRYDAATLSLLGASSFEGAPFEKGRVASVTVAPGGSIYVGYLGLSGRFSFSILSRLGGLTSTKEFEYGAEGLAMTPDGAHLITSTGEIFERESLELLAKVGRLLYGGSIHITRDGRRAFMTGPTPSSVTVVDLTTIPRRVAIAVRPAGVEVHPEPKDEPVIPVAILSAPGFDATGVQPGSVCFGNSQDEERRVCGDARVVRPARDVNGDGSIDLLLTFRESSAGLEGAGPEACLTGKMTTGGRIAGCGAIPTPHFEGGMMSPIVSKPPSE